MTEFIEILRSRRSIRTYGNDPLSDDQLAILTEALLRSPTSRGRNPWQFILVDDPSLLSEAAKAKRHGSSFLSGASLAVVICGDETVSDVWIEDCAIAAITLQYAAHSLGLGSCWAQIRLREHDGESGAEAFLQRLLGIPSHVRVASVIGIGHPAEEKEGHRLEDLPRQKIHRNDF